LKNKDKHKKVVEINGVINHIICNARKLLID